MNSDIKCTAEKKVNKDFFIQAKILISIANLAFKCYAQNLGSKVTNHRRGSFPKGQLEVMASNFFRTCLAQMLQN